MKSFSIKIRVKNFQNPISAPTRHGVGKSLYMNLLCVTVHATRQLVILMKHLVYILMIK